MQNFNILQCPCRRVLQLSVNGYCTARLQGRRERERERRQFKLNMLAARTNFLNYGEPDDHVTRQAMNNAGFRYVLGMTAHT